MRILKTCRYCSATLGIEPDHADDCPMKDLVLAEIDEILYNKNIMSTPVSKIFGEYAVRGLDLDASYEWETLEEKIAAERDAYREANRRNVILIQELANRLGKRAIMDGYELADDPDDEEMVVTKENRWHIGHAR